MTMERMFFEDGRDPKEIISSLGWEQISDESEIRKYCLQVINDSVRS